MVSYHSTVKVFVYGGDIVYSTLGYLHHFTKDVEHKIVVVEVVEIVEVFSIIL
jgi:hypothetical protein